jgi:hypothetical protein
MASINIGAENAGDGFYRYKMPKLAARVRGAAQPPPPLPLARSL